MTGAADVIARLEAELLAARSEIEAYKQRYDDLVNHSHDIISRIDASGRVTYVSPAVREILGYEPDELVGQVGLHFIDPQEHDARRSGFARGIEDGDAPVVVSRTRRKDGTYVWMEYRTTILHDKEGNVVGFQSISSDVTARHQAEEALRRSEQNFEGFVQSMPVPAVIHRDAKVLLANRAFLDGFGYSEDQLVGHGVFDFVDSADRPYIQQRISSPPEQRAGLRSREHELLHADGTRIPVEVTTVPVFFRGELCPMGVVHDLREQKRLEAQLITADRMASLGRLAAAVGHEINNPLAYVLGSLSLLERDVAHLEASPERQRQIRELLANVQEGAERIRAVVQDLRALSRERTDLEGPVDLGRVLDLCTAMADHEVRHRARLVKEYSNLPLVVGSEARLGQVFLNLLINAVQAIPEGDISNNEVRLEARADGEGRVLVDVIDTGAGVEPQLAQRIFDPFFTTKKGVGTGLGLSISRHIVSSLGGTIEATPSPPRGTRFRVVLHAADDGDGATQHARADAVRPNHAEVVRVLVVDDEPQLAQMIARLLRPRAVDVALGGKEAIELIRAGAHYDVILCDLHMTDLSGMEVFEHVREAHAGVEQRMIFMTGGVVSTRAVDFVRNSGCLVLDKPFDAHTLESTIAAILAKTP